MTTKPNPDGTYTVWDKNGYAGKIAAPGKGVSPGGNVEGHVSSLAEQEEKEESFSTAWAKYNREREEQGLKRSAVIADTATDTYSISQKLNPRTGEHYYTAYIRETGQTETFNSYGKAEDWVRVRTGEPLMAKDKYAYKSLMQSAVEWEAYSERTDGSERPILIYSEQFRENEPEHMFSVYRYADPVSPSGESWHVDFVRPDPLIKNVFYDSGRLWEGDQAPSREDLFDALENYYEPSE